jgi:hypothetical protein
LVVDGLPGHEQILRELCRVDGVSILDVDEQPQLCQLQSTGAEQVVGATFEGDRRSLHGREDRPGVHRQERSGDTDVFYRGGVTCGGVADPPAMWPSARRGH